MESKRDVKNLLKPDVLDDDTRRLLMEQVLRAPPPDLGNGHPSPTKGAGLQKHMKQQRNAATDINGEVVYSPSAQKKQNVISSPADVEEDEGSFPSQLRSRVNNSNDDFITAMASRLNELEKRHKNYQLELQEMNSKYQSLQERFKAEHEKRDEAENVVVTLYEEKRELEEELSDIVAFLADYGLQWKGNQGRKKNEAAGEFDLYAGDFSPVTPRDADKAKEDSDGEGSHHSGPINFTNTAQKGTKLFGQKKEVPRERRRSIEEGVDVDLLIKNARILSDYVGYKGVVMEGKMGGIRDRDVVKVIVYKNGIVVNNGLFRPFGWPLCDAFLRDLEEGYYPYEFKDKYPSGYPIEIINKSSEMCSAGLKPEEKKKSEGRRLGGGDDANVHKSAASNIVSAGDKAQGYKPLSKDEFLSKVPKQHVTPSGNLVNVREGVAGFLGRETEGQKMQNGGFLGTVKHVSAAEAQYRAEQRGAQEQPTATPAVPVHEEQKESNTVEPKDTKLGDLVSILFRMPTGQKITLRMSPQNTIEELRKEFIAAAPEFAKEKFELCQSFPVQVFNDHQKTLQSVGLTRSCTLMVRIVQ
ncbi:hypothetical protein STCU_04039 [Strigomonas culicis]|uniref:UBX domain-containing protein 11 n=1 Tax=Strigomonas culicis TaxID=28005 RepID=S9UI47_9TRYP|nr:hypothetical protein STCU_04039 [Strigomonas culicis]|eukprot:EPY30492.1 hypothetical protein STCU_04039 [Strigomonas culicis]